MESLFPFIRDGVLLGISAALSPGPFQSLVIANSLVGGWRKAVPITFAPLIVDIPIAGVLIFVLSQVSESFLNAVRFAGAVMLLFLAWQLWGQIRSGGSSQESPNTESKENGSQRGGLFWGVIMLFLSPGPYLFWSLILGPLLLRALSLSLWHALIFLGAFYLFSIGGLVLIAYVLSRLGELNERALRGLQYASLSLMVVIALLLIQQGLIG